MWLSILGKNFALDSGTKHWPWNLSAVQSRTVDFVKSAPRCTSASQLEVTMRVLGDVGVAQEQGCQMAYSFQTKNPNLVRFCTDLQLEDVGIHILCPFGLHILLQFGILCGYLVYFVVIWSILWLFGVFFPFWYLVQRTIWQSCSSTLCSVLLANANCVIWAAWVFRSNPFGFLKKTRKGGSWRFAAFIPFHIFRDELLPRNPKPLVSIGFAANTHSSTTSRSKSKNIGRQVQVTMYVGNKVG
jgi:hypothetical protein